MVVAIVVHMKFSRRHVASIVSESMKHVEWPDLQSDESLGFVTSNICRSHVFVRFKVVPKVFVCIALCDQGFHSNMLDS